MRLKGNVIDLAGPELKVGDKGTDAALKKSLADEYRISQGRGKFRLISVDLLRPPDPDGQWEHDLETCSACRKVA